MKLKLNIKQRQDQKPKFKRDILYGTGLTKKLVLNTNKVNAKPSIVSFKLKIKEKEEIYKKNNILPSSSLTENVTLDADQLLALTGMLPQKFACLIGSAGTGKTTTLKEFVTRAEKTFIQLDKTDSDGDITYIPAIAFCSFMGKAVQQMKRALPEKYHSLCMTIHALLGFRPVKVNTFDEDGNIIEKMQFLPEYTELNTLPYECIIIDEGGTIPIPLWHYLLAATKSNCRIFILGDLNQLTPVAGHSILGFAMLGWPTFELKTLHRNAGAIAENAHRVIKGYKPLTDKETNKVVIKKIDDGSITARKEILGIIRYLYKKGKFDPLQDAIIVPQNINTLGQEQLNEILVNLFNPEAKRISIKAGTVTKVFAVGDKIMVLKNNNITGLTNGMQGVITEIAPNNNFAGNHVISGEFANIEIDLKGFDTDIANMSMDNTDKEIDKAERASSHIITIQFQDVEEPQVLSTAGDIANITLSYVFTCHKAQGSEYRFVIVVCHSANHRMLSREWLYTAMTRAKESLLILCNNRGLTHAVATQRIKGVTLKEKAEKFIAMTKSAPEDKKVQLPEKETILQPEITFNLKNINKEK